MTMEAEHVYADFAAVRELLSRRAIEQGLCVVGALREDVDAAIETLLSRAVNVPAPTPDECRRWYERNPDECVAGELAFVRHILFAVTPGTPVEPLRRKAEATLGELRRSPERFAERRASCRTARQGRKAARWDRWAVAKPLRSSKRRSSGTRRPACCPRS